MLKRPVENAGNIRTPSKRRRLSLSSYTSPLSNSKSTPSDSPSNPFGTYRTHILSLPEPTSFSKHLPLRFQLVRPFRQKNPHESVYRVVQVPLNFSLGVLGRLVMWLFGGHPVVPVERRTRSYTKKLVDFERVREENGGDDDDEGEMPVTRWEIQDCFELEDEGVIKAGQTWASVKAPFLIDEDDEDDEGEDSDDEERWTWEEESDITLNHVWPYGGDLSQGIVFHHSTTTQIHITINRLPLPRRKGVSNKPYIFQGCGIVYLRPPRRPIPSPFHGIEGANIEEEEEEYGRKKAPLVVRDDPVLELCPQRWNWNIPCIFERYLKKDCERVARTLVLDDSMGGSSGSSEGDSILDDFEFDISASSLPTFSSPAGISSLSANPSPRTLLPLYPTNPITPFPALSASHRRRVERTSERIKRLAKKIGKEGIEGEELMSEDEGEDEFEVEVDELEGVEQDV